MPGAEIGATVRQIVEALLSSQWLINQTFTKPVRDSRRGDETTAANSHGCFEYTSPAIHPAELRTVNRGAQSLQLRAWLFAECEGGISSTG